MKSPRQYLLWHALDIEDEETKPDICPLRWRWSWRTMFLPQNLCRPWPRLLQMDRNDQSRSFQPHHCMNNSEHCLNDQSHREVRDARLKNNFCNLASIQDSFHRVSTAMRFPWVDAMQKRKFKTQMAIMKVSSCWIAAVYFCSVLRREEKRATGN